MRRPRVVASLALIALLAPVAVPGPVGSRAPSPTVIPATERFETVRVDASVRGPVTTIQPLDPGARSDGILDHGSTLFEPDQRSEPLQARPRAVQPTVDPGVIRKRIWHRDPEISWYGPGLIGNGTACGQTLTRRLLGVAHRTLPCGTLITFKSGGVTLTVPVVDRGPFVEGRIFDLTYAACKRLHHCHTGPINWRYGPSN